MSLQDSLPVQDGSFASVLRLSRLVGLLSYCLTRKRSAAVAVKAVEPESEEERADPVDPNREIDAWLRMRAIQDAYGRPIA